MKLDLARVGDIAILEFRGELDAYNLAPLAKAIDKVIEGGDLKLCFNVKRLTFINSSGLGYILKVRKRVVAEGGDVVLAEPSKFLRKVMATLGLDRVVTLFETEDEALEYFESDTGRTDTGTVELADEEKDESLAGANAILFAVDVEKRRRKYAGRITSLYSNGLKFRWEVPGWSRERRPPLSTANFDKVIKTGMRLGVKFRQPFMVKGHYFEFDSTVVRVTRDTLDDGTNEAYFVLEYVNPSADDQKLLERFVSDMELFRKELEEVEQASDGS